MTLLATAIFLNPQDDSPAPRLPWQGAVLRGWFLEALRRTSPTLAEDAEAGDRMRPYTVSDLIHWKDRAASPETPAQLLLRLTSLKPELSEHLCDILLPSLIGESVVLGGHRCVIQHYCIDNSEHPLAGVIHATDLLQQASLPSFLPPSLALRFHSPTAFRHQGDPNFPIPLPELVFGNLLQRWNSFNTLKLPPDLRRFASECLRINRYKANTEMVRWPLDGDFLQMVGTRGMYRYLITQGDHYWRGLVFALASYSFYAGVGIRTTMGFGRASLIP